MAQSNRMSFFDFCMMQKIWIFWQDDFEGWLGQARGFDLLAF
jgi:hypothetical protein